MQLYQVPTPQGTEVPGYDLLTLSFDAVREEIASSQLQIFIQM